MYDRVRTGSPPATKHGRGARQREHPVLALQRKAGNRAVARLVAERRLQRQFDVASDVRDWSTLANIKRSSGGVTSGVVFATSTGGDRLVVKFLKEGSGPQVADLIISRVLGIRTPASRVLGKAETKAAKKEIKGRLSDIADKERRKNVKKQLDQPVIQIQGFADATPFGDLTVEDRLALLANKRILRTVGKMAMGDALMANYDRVTPTQCNLGNLMLTPDGEVIAIDNDAHFDDGSHDVSIRDIDTLLSARGARVLASTFLAGMLRPVPVERTKDVDMDFVEGAIGRGILEGAAALLGGIDTGLMAEAENIENFMHTRTKKRTIRHQEMQSRLDEIRAKMADLVH